MCNLVQTSPSSAFSRLLYPLAAFAVLLGAGCVSADDDEDDEPAPYVSPCDAGRVFLESYGCLVRCELESDCPSDQYCREFPDGTMACSNQPCNDDEVETANRGCLTKCRSDKACEAGKECKNVGLSSRVCWDDTPDDSSNDCAPDQLATSSHGCVTTCRSNKSCSLGQTCKDAGLSSRVCWPPLGDGM